MATPIAPQFAIDEVVLETVRINYNPVWDGANWVLDPTTIEVNGIANLGVDGNNVTGGSILLTADTLPAAGQTALQDLYGYIEQSIADQYP